MTDMGSANNRDIRPLDSALLYLKMFNAATDALEPLELGNVEMAKARLRSAQQMCEEIYMQAEDGPPLTN